MRESGRGFGTGCMVKIISDANMARSSASHLGPRATELITWGHGMKHEIGVEDIKAMVFAHPTFSEASTRLHWT